MLLTISDHPKIEESTTETVQFEKQYAPTQPFVTTRPKMTTKKRSIIKFTQPITIEQDQFDKEATQSNKKSLTKLTTTEMPPSKLINRKIQATVFILDTTEPGEFEIQHAPTNLNTKSLTKPTTTRFPLKLTTAKIQAKLAIQETAKQDEIEFNTQDTTEHSEFRIQLAPTNPFPKTVPKLTTTRIPIKMTTLKIQNKVPFQETTTEQGEIEVEPRDSAEQDEVEDTNKETTEHGEFEIQHAPTNPNSENNTKTIHDTHSIKKDLAKNSG